MKYGVIALVCLLIVGAGTASGRQATPANESPRSPWLAVPLASSSPKLGTAFGGMAAYLKVFDPESRVSLFGVNYQYTTTDSQVAALFARASLGADHHRIVTIGAFGYIKNDYSDYLGTGQELRTNDDLKAIVGRYLYRIHGDWFVGGQASAANYQVLGETPEDDAMLETLGVRGQESAGVGVTVMHDSRDNEDMPTRGWFANLNNVAYREGLGGSDSYDAYRADLRAFWTHGRASVLAVRQYNWLTSGAPLTGQATVVLRGYKAGQYLAPYMSSFEIEERWSFNPRWGATLFAGAATLYGQDDEATETRAAYPAFGGGLHFVIKPEARLVLNLEYAQAIEDNRGVYLKFGYGW